MKIIPYGKTTAEEIKALESEFEMTLPDDYKEFLLNNNGGVPEVKYAAFYVEELKEDISLDVLYGIGVEKLDVSRWSNMFRNDLPPRSLVIGVDPGGGMLLLINDGEDNGVYYWDDSYSFEESDDDRNTYFVADSFTDFVDSLKPLED
jgi:hypothetical protein